VSLPRLDPASPHGDGSAGVVLVLHGGRPDGRDSADGLRLPYLRMVPFGRAVARAGADLGVDVELLRYRYRGWNAPDLDPVQDARWAIAEARARHGRDVEVVLVGHSMGGRAALRVGDDPSVVGVVGLAPWIERDEPWRQIGPRDDGAPGPYVLIAHGDRERMTDPRLSLWFAEQLATVSDRVARFDVHGDGHAMLRRAGEWHGLVAGFALACLGLEPFDESVANAMAEGALSVPLVRESEESTA
jgi:dienelactone hydrolase